MVEQNDLRGRIEEKANHRLRDKVDNNSIDTDEIRKHLKNALVVEIAYDLYSKKISSKADKLIRQLDDWDIRFIFEVKREHPYARSLDICQKVLTDKYKSTGLVDKVLGKLGLQRRSL